MQGISNNNAGFHWAHTLDVESADQFFWLDYFCLRQCQNDFVAELIVPLVHSIGTLVAHIDVSVNELEKGSAYKDANYLQRSFCILELYAAVVGEVSLVCHTGFESYALEDILSSDPPRDDNGKVSGLQVSSVKCSQCRQYQ
jgi:hypothetical protein